MSIKIDDSIILFNKKIKNIEYIIAKCDFVKTHFPNCQINVGMVEINPRKNIKSGYKEHEYNISFKSKSVNSEFTKFEFQNHFNSLNIKVFTELNWENEIIKVNSSPETCKLARLCYRPYTQNGAIKFSKFSFNMKKNNFKEHIFNFCRSEIMKFVQMHPNAEIDSKNLEPRLKKLLTFT